jgi:glycosyltransferase involved in cell wall biosynthesis
VNILSYIHIHRLPNPSGVGRVIDQLLTSHARRYPASCHRMLVDGALYDDVYMDLGDHWKTASFIPHSPSTSWQQAMWVMRNKPVAECYWDDVDIVYCPAESYVPTSRAKLVCTIHDVAGFEEGLYPNDRHKQAHCLKWRILFKSIARYADAVVTVSNFSASRIAHFFPDLESKLSVVYNAPHTVFGSPSSIDLEQQVDGIAGGAPYILVPGGLSLRKNAGLIIKAIPRIAEAMPEVKVVVAGSNDSEYVRQLGVAGASNVILPGYVSDELLNTLYQKAEVVWFPSRYEGFGMPVIEAMVAGAPVVSSTAASIPEVVEDAALLCDMDDPAAHVEAIRSLVSSPSKTDEMRAKSREQAKRYTWSAAAGQLETLFQSL